jgi:hypothetical protein
MCVRNGVLYFATLINVHGFMGDQFKGNADHFLYFVPNFCQF